VINIPELLLELVLPPTELTGAGALLELVQPASQMKPVIVPQHGLR
jgi:hypothetical protein